MSSPKRFIASVATTSWGEINTPLSVSTKLTRSPFFRPSFLRISVGMVTCPFSCTTDNLKLDIANSSLVIQSYFGEIITRGKHNTRGQHEPSYRREAAEPAHEPGATSVRRVPCLGEM